MNPYLESKISRLIYRSRLARMIPIIFERKVIHQIKSTYWRLEGRFKQISVRQDMLKILVVSTLTAARILLFRGRGDVENSFWRESESSQHSRSGEFASVRAVSYPAMVLNPAKILLPASHQCLALVWVRLYINYLSL